MRALITGIEGFVGGYLADELINNNLDVYGTYFDERTLEDELMKKAKLYSMDITNDKQVEKTIQEIQPDYIFHLAAQSSAGISWQKPQQTMTININGTINLLEAIRKLKIQSRVILIGSSEEYGIVKESENPISEEQELRPGNPYSVSKITQEKLAELYTNAYGMDIVMTRSFNHTGPKQQPAFVISDFAKRIVEIEHGSIEPILHVGNLEARRDFLDVRDVVKAYYIIALKGLKGEVYNVGSGKSYSIQELLNYMLDKSSIKIDVQKDLKRMRPSDNPVIQCDNQKLRRLGWSPMININQTIDDVLAYWEKRM
ncbi:MAG: GDP-mannose 4,6-dehydratase [Tissierellia bacterium]|nr:GDP-mannose 4,6-dehydratase [Tissierellia bacterium]